MSSIGGRVRDWFNGGDPDGRAKLRAWARGHDGRSEGYTYGMMGPAVGLSVLAALLYAPTKGYGSIVALVLAIFLLLGRQMIERQVARDAADLHEAERQYVRTRNSEYLDFTELRAGGLLEDNKMLTRETRDWLTGRVEWAQGEKEKLARRAERAERRRAKGGRGRSGNGGRNSGSKR
ncbi:MAG: hypothetical protein I3J03_05310 [Actinomyces succiniciruminis]|uniref:Conserved domain protein n=1 Tax=Actinomyces succiniciruminis TaxID=1522002 RepID=A0A1L7R9M0_9ACTO|nr:hypothetical protein [Actinomyces succiniciruminis]MBM6979115.1 hypothetical protein [Actinomyces succiniciruminis]CED90541.1 Conserved domain protein [Actinomyces succiniciruminis]